VVSCKGDWPGCEERSACRKGCGDDSSESSKQQLVNLLVGFELGDV
jgi:hypothetical protein